MGIFPVIHQVLRMVDANSECEAMDSETMLDPLAMDGFMRTMLESNIGKQQQVGDDTSSVLSVSTRTPGDDDNLSDVGSVSTVQGLLCLACNQPHVARSCWGASHKRAFDSSYRQASKDQASEVYTKCC